MLVGFFGPLIERKKKMIKMEKKKRSELKRVNGIKCERFVCGMVDFEIRSE